MRTVLAHQRLGQAGFHRIRQKNPQNAVKEIVTS
jgi:hypothetical protein